MQGRFKMEYRLFTIVRYNYRDYNIWTKNVFPHFSANDCDLFLHIMLALGYYHSMMLRVNQSLLRGHNCSTETTSC